MPKLKTRKGAAKRIKVSGTGKLLHRRASGRHFLSKKSGSRKRRFGADYELTGKAAKNMERMLGDHK